jgi:hypothetical protein
MTFPKHQLLEETYCESPPFFFAFVLFYDYKTNQSFVDGIFSCLFLFEISKVTETELEVLHKRFKKVANGKPFITKVR